MKVLVRGTVEREIEVDDDYRDTADDIILEDYVFGEDGLMDDSAEVVNGITWEVVERL